MNSVLAIFFAVALCQAEAATRVVGGTVVSADRRSTVAIFSYDENNPTFVDKYCSGALIHPEWVLTSATCVKMAEKYDMRVTTKDINTMTHAIFNEAYMIKNKIAHPNFVAQTLLNDIGLIQIEDHMKTDARTLKLLQVAMDVTNKAAFVRGYGENRVPADNLKQKERKDIFIVDNSRCVLKDFPMTNKICTLEPVACKGDQGGPLILKNTNTIVGITSLDENNLELCGISPILSFTPYTNVWPFKQWIRQTTNLNL